MRIIYNYLKRQHAATMVILTLTKFFASHYTPMRRVGTHHPSYTRRLGVWQALPPKIAMPMRRMGNQHAYAWRA